MRYRVTVSCGVSRFFTLARNTMTAVARVAVASVTDAAITSVAETCWSVTSWSRRSSNAAIVSS